MLPPQKHYSDQELREIANEDPNEAMRETARRMLERRLRHQAEADEARDRWRSTEAQQQREQGEKL